MAIKKFQIRFNVRSTTENERWRLITDGQEILVSNIVINGHTATTMDWMEDIQEYKWHISCEGELVIKNNIAYVITVKEESVLARHILKTISYRIFGIQADDIAEGVLTGSATFLPTGTANQTQANVTLTVLDDKKTEGIETIVLILDPDFPYSLQI